MSYQLRPTGFGCNNIKSITITENEECIVGRNSNTFSDVNCENSPLVSRKHAILEVKHGKLILKPVSKLVYINEKQWNQDTDSSEVVLDYGDIISLLGVANYFNFVITGMNRTSSSSAMIAPASFVTISDNEADILAVNSSTHATAPVAPPPAPASVEIPKSELERSLECTICFELMACAHQLNSCQCGTSYCYSCISALNMCPACRVACTPANLIPNRIVDEFCHTIIKDNKDAFVDWETRTKAGLELKKSSTGGGVVRTISNSAVTKPATTTITATVASIASVKPKPGLSAVATPTISMAPVTSKPKPKRDYGMGMGMGMNSKNSNSNNNVVVLGDTDPSSKKFKTSSSGGIISFAPQRPITKTKAPPVAAVYECIDLT